MPIPTAEDFYGKDDCMGHTQAPFWMEHSDMLFWMALRPKTEKLSTA